jgi:CRP-like cAMP-binding protein
MDDFFQFCNQLSPLNQEASKHLSEVMFTKNFERNDYFLKEGEVCKYLYFINRGLVKTFFYKYDKEFIMRFFTEGTMFTVLDSYLNEAPSSFMVVALEPTSVTCVSSFDMKRLCKQHHCIETFFRKLVSIAAVNMMKRISEMLDENATESYLHFLEENGDLLQRISLGDLASYLGITQVSLSRIRAKK